jgi:ankyrin repeat protein
MTHVVKSGNAYMQPVDGALVIHQDALQKRTPLMFAIINGHSETAQKLIQATKDAGALDMPDAMGMTSLMHASETGLSDTVEQLVAAGAKAELVDKAKGRTALMHACAHWRTTACHKLILPTQAAGALDLQDVNGMTCLMHACECGLGTVVQQLLDVGAKIDLLDKQKRFGFMHACRKGHAHVAEMLLEKASAAEQLHRKDSLDKSSLIYCRDRISDLEAANVPQSVSSLVIRHITSDEAKAQAPPRSALTLIASDISSQTSNIAGLTRIVTRIKEAPGAEAHVETKHISSVCSCLPVDDCAHRLTCM